MGFFHSEMKVGIMLSVCDQDSRVGGWGGWGWRGGFKAMFFLVRNALYRENVQICDIL